MLIVDGILWANKTRMAGIAFREDRTSPGPCGKVFRTKSSTSVFHLHSFGLPHSSTR